MLGLKARICTAAVAVVGSILVGCGTDSPTATVGTGTVRGTLLYDPPFRIASVDAATFAAQLGATASGQQLLTLAGKPTCGVDFYHIEYNTVGGKGEATTASGALMVPTGAAPTCSGPRPIVLYAHGTNPDKTFNIADITNPNNTEGALIAAVFAAQGYIVVAPNYAGYDTSTLPYHPYVNGDQQSKDMIDALTAARTGLPQTSSAATSDSGTLFITGYSQGGYVAMATNKAMQAAGAKVTAAAPMSGPYALEAYGDAIFLGNVVVGSTVFAPLLTASYQTAYQNLYTTPADIFNPAFGDTVATLLPSATPLDTLFAEGKLPELALFDSTTPVTGNAVLDHVLAIPSNPVFAAGFGEPNLIINAYRVPYVEDALAHPDGAVTIPPTAGAPLATGPQHPLRIDFQQNDMRSWIPENPMLLCGGDQDPTVLFPVNTGAMQAYWSALPPGLVTVVDVNATPGAGDPFAPLQVAFQQQLAALLASGGEEAVALNYHTTVAPFCTLAARSFFSQF